MNNLQECFQQSMQLLSPAEKGVLTDLLFQAIPATHGLSGYLDLDLLRKRHGFQLEFFLMSSWALLGRDTIQLAEQWAQSYSCSGGDPEEEWVKETHWGIAFVTYLEMSQPWLCDEIDRMLEDLDSDLLQATTCAPKQLLFQWFCESYRRTLVGLAAVGAGSGSGSSEFAASVIRLKEMCTRS